MRKRFINSVLVCGLSVSIAGGAFPGTASSAGFAVPTPSKLAAERRQSKSVRLQKWAFRQEKGQPPALVLRLGNYGEGDVNINMISLSRGGWTAVNKNISPGATLTLAYAMPDPPAYIDVDASDGFAHLELTPETEAK